MKKKKGMVGLLKFYFEDGQELNLNQKNKSSSTTLEHYKDIENFKRTINNELYVTGKHVTDL